MFRWLKQWKQQMQVLIHKPNQGKPAHNIIFTFGVQQKIMQREIKWCLILTRTQRINLARDIHQIRGGQ